MTEHNHPNSDGENRTEPTLGQGGRKDGAQQNTAAPGNEKHESAAQSREDFLKHERRDERRHVRLSPPFHAKMPDDRVLTGGDLALGGFALYSEEALEPGTPVDISLLLEAGSAEFNVPVQARCVRSVPTDDGQAYKNAFEITSIEAPQREVLRRVIRAYLSGHHASIEDMVGGQDPQTPRKRSNTRRSTPPVSQPPKPWGRYIALFAAAGILALVAAATVYRNFMLIEPSFAAVTAPRIDIRAPGPGILEQHNLEAGDRVERDQYLTSVNNSDLQSDLILAEASHRYNSQLIENLQESLNNAGVEQVSLANSAQPGSGETVSFETASPEIARTRIEQFETARDYESSRISALQARMSQNEISSPCNCLVAWALSSADGTYINESERIMTLIRTEDEDDILVEALVHMSDIARIEPEQTAYVSLANSNEAIRAKVRNVALDIERQPRAGFPSWVRQQQNVASVLLVPEEPLPPESVGQPVDVRFAETPVLSAMSEWIWQGTSSVVSFVDEIYKTAVNESDEEAG
ncbi:HlyD family efflux transporter periplasmic adaptor subunit [Litchfieldella xinjiangensis]|uniref:HlyD family efflux transporter periplasmic adaptor subunit n=1 Tax=Litchfieldella xinjiangensis TaxID=1166948 RepID=UPI0005BB9465|nr:HlyD family efflux transporter periplasmic adaptor subunit [Halomonas xinjiangensis]